MLQPTSIEARHQCADRQPERSAILSMPPTQGELSSISCEGINFSNVFSTVEWLTESNLKAIAALEMTNLFAILPEWFAWRQPDGGLGVAQRVFLL